MGGAEVFIVQLSNYLLEKNYKVKILTVSGIKDLPHNIDKRIELKSLEKNTTREAIFELLSFFRKNDFDIFVANVWPLTFLASLANLFSLRKKSILIEHGVLSKNFENESSFFKFLHNLSILVFHNLSSKVIAVSNAIKKDLIKKGVSQKKITTIYNSFRKLPTTNESGLSFADWTDFSGLKLISIANLKPEKNLFSLLRAQEILQNKFNVKTKLLVIGDGPQKDELKAAALKMKISENVIFSGFVYNPYPYLNRADILVLSSENEGFGISIIEGLSLGKTIVSTNCEGPSEIINERGLGFLCRKNDDLDLAKTILLASKSSPDKNKLLLRSKDFSIENIGAQYEDLLEEISTK